MSITLNEDYSALSLSFLVSLLGDDSTILTLSVSAGHLILTDGGASPDVTIEGSGTDSVTVTASSKADLADWLADMVNNSSIYITAFNSLEPVTLDYVIDNGTSDDITGTEQLVFTPVNDPACLDMNGSDEVGCTYVTKWIVGSVDPISILDKDWVSGDPDGVSMITSAIITLSGRLDVIASEFLSTSLEGATTYEGESGTITIYGDSTRSIILSGDASLADYMAVISGIVYQNTLPNTSKTGDRVVTISMTDVDGIAANSSAISLLTPIDVTLVNEGDRIFIDTGDGMVDSGLTVLMVKDATHVIASGELPIFDSAFADGHYFLNFLAPTADPDAEEWSTDELEGVPTVLTTTIVVAKVPIVDLNGAAVGSDGTLAYLEGDSSAFIAPVGTITSLEATMASLVITLSGVLDDAHESLSFTGTLPTGVTSSVSSSDGTYVLTLSGSKAIADYQALLRTIIYTNTSESPDVTDVRTITVYATNTGGVEGISQEVAVTVAGVNDAPVITPVVVTGTVVEDVVFSASGSMTYADVDVNTDTMTVTISESTVTSFDQELTAEQIAAIKSAFSIVPESGTTGVTPAGSVSWTYVVGAHELDFLAYNVTVAAVFTISVDDGHGGIDAQSVTISITGTDDAPVITVAEGDASIGIVSEDVAVVVDNPNTVDVENGGYIVASGMLSYSDADAADELSIVSYAQQGGATSSEGVVVTSALAVALSSALVVGSISGNSGDFDWSFALDNSLVQYLGAGDSVTVNYLITIADNSGAADNAAQLLSITVNGTNDTPVISFALGNDAGAVAEDGAESLTAGGTVSFSEVDAYDELSSSVDLTSIEWSATDAGGAHIPLPDSFATALEGAMSIVQSGINDGSIGWNFELENNLTQFLAKDEVVTAVFTITVDDAKGGTDTQDVTITLTGSNDAPVITVGEDGSIADLLTEADGALKADGTLSVEDLDTTNSVAVSVDSVAASQLDGSGVAMARDSSEPASADLLAMLTATADPIDGTVTTGDIAWAFNSGSEAFNYLAAGEKLVLTYTLTASDGTASDDQTVTITITGTNDIPSVDVTDVKPILESTDAHAQVLADSGTVTFNDIDSTDLIDVTCAYNEDIVWSGGTINGALAVALVDGFSVDTGDNLEAPGNTAWNYSVAGVDLDFLSEGETITFSYTVTATDTQSASSTDTVEITISGTNDVPVVTNEAEALAGEVVEAGNLDDGEVSAGTVSATGTLSSSDVDASATATWSLLGTPSTTYGTMAIDSASGFWTYSLDNSLEATKALDEGESATQTYTARVTDDKGAYVDQTITITISGTNDVPVVTNEAEALAGEVVEAGNLDDGEVSAGTVSATGTLSSSDVDASATATWSLLGTPSTTYGTMAIDSASGFWTYSLDNSLEATKALDEGESATQTYTARVTDDKGAYVDQTITITISGTNDVPVVTNEAEALAGEVVEAGNLDDGEVSAGTVSATGTLSSSDVDASATATWSLLGTPSTTYGTMAIDSASGFWTYSLDNSLEATKALDEGESATQTYTARVTDDKGAYVDQTITITISGTNDVPVVTNEAEALAGEVVEAGNLDDGEVSAGTVSATGTLSSSDVDASATATWSLLGTPSTTYGTMAIDSASGFWTYSLDNSLEATKALDEGESATQTYTARVTDDKGAYVDQTITITISGTNDVPVVTNEAEALAGEVVEAGNLDDGEVSAGTVSATGTLSSSDVDASATATWSLLGTPSTTYGTMAIDSASGFWTYSLDNSLEATKALDEGESATQTYTARVTDDKGAYVDQTITITISGTNDVPVVTNEAEALAGEVVEAGNLDDGEVSAGTVSATGTLSSSDVDASATATWSLLGTPSTTYGTMAIDSASGFWTYSLDNSLEATKALDEGESATQTYTARVTDDKGAYVDQTITITISGTNDVPVVTNEAEALAGEVVEAGNLDDGEVSAGTVSATGTLSSSDVDASATATWSLLGTPSTTYGTMAIDSASGFWTYSLDNSLEATKALDEGESATQTYTARVTDDKGAYVDQTITITISGTNDVPVVTNEAEALAGEVVEAGNLDDGEVSAGTVSATGTLSSSDVDASATATWSLLGTPSTTYGTMAIDSASGFWTYSLDNSLEATKALDEGESATQTYTARVTDDKGAYVDQTITITISGTNDVPVVTNEAEALAGEVVEAGNLDDGEVSAGTVSATGTLSSSDVDASATATWSLLGTPSTTYGTMAIDSASGFWTYSLDNSLEATKALDEGESATQTYTARVTDDKGAYVDQTITITISGTNDVPVVTNEAEALAGEVVEAGNLDDGEVSAGTVSATGTLSSSDVDASATATWSLLGTPSTTYGTMAIDSASGFWTYSLDNSLEATKALDEGESATQTYTARVTDDKGAYVDQTITITISGTNDVPVVTNEAEALAGEVVEAGNLDDGEVSAGTVSATGTLSSSDVDASATATWSLLGTPSTTYGTMAIDSASGFWTYSLDNSLEATKALDEGESATQTYTARVTDDKGAYVDQTITITISGTNDVPVVTNEAEALAGEVVEAGNLDDGEVSAGTVSATGTLSSSDVDASATATWSLLGTPSTTYGTMAIDSASGFWTYSLDNSLEATKALDEGESATQTYTARVTDDKGAYVDQTITITISGTNDVPVVTNEAEALAGEVVEAGNLDDGEVSAGTVSATGTLSSSDVDASATATWSLLGTPSTTYGTMAIDSASGFWTYSLDNSLEATKALDEGESATQTYTARVTDDKGAYVDQTITITISGTNDVPVVTNEAEALAGEVVEAGNLDDGEVSAGTVSATGTLSSSDVDASATATWSLLGTPSTTYGTMAIDSASGFWTYSLDNSLEATKALDEGESATQTYTARVTDDKGAYVDQTITITISGTNDVPVVTNEAEALAGEVVEAGNLDDGEVSAGTVSATGTLSSSDVDASATATWSLLGTPSTTYGTMAIDSASGFWTYSLDNSLEATKALDEGESATQTYTARVTDDKGAYVDQTITITISGTNDVPVVTNEAEALAGEVVEAGNLDDGEVSAGTVSATGTLSSSDVDASATATWSLLGTPSTTYGTMAIDSASGFWTYSLDNSLEATKALDEGESATQTYTARVTDDKGAYVDQTITITISGTNDVPVVTNEAEALAGEVVEAGNLDDGEVSAGTVSATGTLSSSDVDASATATWSLLGTPSTTYGTMAIDSASGFWTYSLDNSLEATKALDEGESATQTYTARVTDDKGAYVDQTITITISGTNDVPVVTNEAEALAGEVVEAGNLDDGEVSAGTVSATGTLSSSDVDASATATWSLLGTPSTTYGTMAIDSASGFWTYSLDNSLEATKALDEGESATQTYTARVTDDKGAYVDQTITITISGTNDVPVVTNEAEALAGEVVEAGNLDDGEVSAGTVSATGTLSSSDVDASATATWSLLGTPSTTYGTMAIDSASGFWTYSLDNSLEATKALDEGESATQTYTARVTDDKGAYVDQTITITISGTNDVPVVTNEAEALAGEVVEAGNLDDGEVSAGTVSATGTLSSSDVDASATATWSLLGTPSTTYGTMAIDSASGFWTYSLDNSLEATKALDEGESATQTYTARVTDDKGAYVDQTITITISGTNDVPVVTNEAEALAGEVVEAGNLDDGEVSAGTVSATGTLSSSDVDASATATWSLLGTPSTTYGTMAIDSASGFWTYSLDNSLEATKALDEGESATQTYTARVTDDKGAYVDQTITITISGTNDVPVVTNEAEALAGEVVEAGNLDDGEVSAGTVSATGTLSSSDVDASATATWSLLGTPSTTYGTMAIDSASGFWTYSLDNSLEATKALDEGESATQTYTARVTDDKGAYVDQTITITISGTNDVPVVTNEAEALAGEVVEAGNLDDGEVSAGTVSATGTLSSSDVDASATATWSLLGTPSTTYGTMAIDSASGFWTYSLDNSLEATKALDEGESATQTYTARVTDDKGAYVDQTITITISGTNDVPVVTNEAEALAGEVVEAGNLDDGEVSAGTVSATGTLSSSDVDASATATWSLLGTPSTTYGTMAIDSASGFWTYSLDNSLEATKALDEGESATQTYTARVTDDKGAYVDQTITITISGTNDVPVVTNEAEALAGEVVEAGNLDDGEVSAGTVSATGTLSSSDVDASATATWSLLGTPSTTYGTMAIDSASGFWTYSLDNSLEATKALDEGESATQTYTARVTDDKGAYVDQTITITISGTNDVPVVTNEAEALAGEVVEAGNLDDGEVSAGTVSATGTLSSSDVDASATATWSLLGTPSTTYGTMAIDSASGFWTYSLDNSLEATKALDEGESATQTYTARVTDDKGAYVDQTITITISGTLDRYTPTTHVTFWKDNTADDGYNPLALEGVTTGYVPDVTSSTEDTIEFRDMSVALNDAGAYRDYTMDVWKANKVEDVNTFTLKFDLPTGTTYEWDAADVFTTGWNISEYQNDQTVTIVGYSLTETIDDAAVQLGTLTFSGNLNTDTLNLTGGVLTAVNLTDFSEDSTATGTIVLDPVMTDTDATGADALEAAIDQGGYSLLSSASIAIADGTVSNIDMVIAAMIVAADDSAEDSNLIGNYTLAQLYAADVDHSGTVDATDVALIGQMSAGVTEAPANEWIFVAADVADDAATGTSVDWTKTLTEIDLQSNATVELVGIVKGDVNGSWVG
ncbi:VCBS domain-containing protein [Pelodictyon luteolum]|uniref:VCBS protein n=1 Tax=Chlorobium luteolum (strain DSM 273 / BCRC 81028 / 2530) TaxID=319225 RepID=Q3B527_CHLL3|nr:VCBS domain-containing protein [Pelodictyon luteolum]ABB23554.1 VCBS protein [Pelodictyon luteolum DSM 273]